MPEFRTRPNGTVYPLTPRRGGGPLVAVLVTVALAGGGGAVGVGGLGTSRAASADAPDTAAALPGNLTADVVDSLPGRDLATRRVEARRSARRGRAGEAWSRLGLKQLRRRVEHAAERELDCVAAATGQVRTFLVHTPCTSLDRMLVAVGDGHGNTAVVSVIRVGFRTAAQARAFREVEDTPASGDVRPLEIAAALRLTGIELCDDHYHSRLDRAATVVAEADPATGHVDGARLDVIAETACYLPVT